MCKLQGPVGKSAVRGAGFRTGIGGGLRRAGQRAGGRGPRRAQVEVSLDGGRGGAASAGEGGGDGAVHAVKPPAGPGEVGRPMDPGLEAGGRVEDDLELLRCHVVPFSFRALRIAQGVGQILTQA